MKTLTALAILVSLLAGAERAEAQTNASSSALRPGDFVRISVWPDTEYSGEFIVEESGEVYLPLLGAVNVVDTSMDAVRSRLREQYAASLNSVVSVTPAYNVSVLGDVQRPGLYVITPTDGLFDVIGMAGGFRSSPDGGNIRVVREGEVVRIDATTALTSGIGLNPLALRSGDQIIVDPRGSFGWDRMRDLLALFQSVALVITVAERLR